MRAAGLLQVEFLVLIVLGVRRGSLGCPCTPSCGNPLLLGSCEAARSPAKEWRRGCRSHLCGVTALDSRLSLVIAGTCSSEDLGKALSWQETECQDKE